MRTALSRPDLSDPAFAARWQAHAAASGAPVFLSWTWLGCLAAERFDDPLLVEAHDGDALISMALFNRRRTRGSTSLHLHESGDPAQDAVFIEHNGPVAAPERQGAAMTATLRAVQPLADQVVLSGIGDAGLNAVQALGGLIDPLRTRPAPFATLDPAGPPFIDGLSRNTRAQLRRSDRAYAEAGPIRVERAATADQGAAFLAELLRLHTAGWAARGIASAFATAPVQRFHHALIGQGVAAGAVDLLRITAGRRVIGVLLNLRAGDGVASYQSGFDYAGAGPHEKPGLTCHHAAIEHARKLGAVSYDFLAGDSRYKRSFSHAERPMHWLTWRPRPSLLHIGRHRAVAFLRTVAGR